MVKVKATKPAKRYTFSSFRDRIDSIKIEPSKRLNARAFDDAETSHFLSTLERWIEFNRSGVFSNFVEKVENLSQSLPQLLHYKSQIFEELRTAISKHDELSLQPLLELLTQFCHDLGPDFLEFYEQTIKLITELALKENTSDTLEWEFNCLAFVFKYLSKSLTQDLIPTFELLLPLFNSKEHVARFSAEAMSFLLRKTSQDNLIRFTEFAFAKAGAENYNRALSTLFSEAMQSIEGSIHSKSHIIIKSLLTTLEDDKVSSVLGDILLNIINYGSESSVKDIYTLVIGTISYKIREDSAYLDHYVKILAVLIFADSGRKIPDWALITDSISYLIDNVDLKTTNKNSKDLMIYMFAIFMRNCELQTLTTFHSTLLQYTLTLDSLFLPFVSMTLELTKERALKYSRPFVQEFVNKQWKKNSSQIAYFIDDLNRRDLLTTKEDSSKLRLLVPSAFTETILQELTTINVNGEDDLYEVFWRLTILSHSTQVHHEGLVALMETVKKFELDTQFKITILSQIASLILSTDYSEKSQIVLNNFEELYTNPLFLSSTTSQFNQKGTTLPENTSELIMTLSGNLISPDHTLRHETLELIKCLSSSTDKDTYMVACQADIIEQMPLTLANSRDVTLRMRSFASQFKATESSETVASEVYFKFLFGMLSVHFSPTWKGVYEALPLTFHKNRPLIWKLAYSFIMEDHTKNIRPFFTGFAYELEEETVEWEVIDNRLYGVVSAASGTIAKYRNHKQSLLNSAEKYNSSAPYADYMRPHCLTALKTVPEVAEANATDLVGLILDDEYEENKNTRGFSKKERSSILELFASFKKLKSIPRAEELYTAMLLLLSNKDADIRKIALNCLLNFKNKHVTKYRDSLTNLLDDAMFRDEIQKITSKGDDSIIEAEDEEYVMPLILRIIFGRAQTTTSNGSKKGMKFGALSVLPSLPPAQIENFLAIVAEKVYDPSQDVEDDWTSLVTSPENVTSALLRRHLGYSNMLSELISALGEKFRELLPQTLKPLLTCLLTVEGVIQSKVDENLLSAARSVRQSGMKDLYMLFNILEDFNWDSYIEVIYERVLSPRFAHFEDENLQQPSALLKILVCWSERKSYVDLLMINDLEPAENVLSLLKNTLTKNDVVSVVLDFCTNLIIKTSKKAKYQKLLALIAENVFDSLESILNRVTDQNVNSKTIHLLLGLVEQGHVQNQERRSKLVSLATQLLEKSNAHMSKDLKLEVLRILQTLIRDFEGDFKDIEHLYEVASRFLKFFTDRQQRVLLVDLFVDIGLKFDEYSRVATYLSDLNSYSSHGLAEYDYDRRLDAFREINEETFGELSALEWIPILNSVIFFINEIDELAIRTNASYTLKKFVEALSTRESADKSLLHLFKDLLLPNLRVGLRSKKDAVQSEYISVLAYIISNVKYVDDFEDMKVLLSNGNDDVNFFTNINHIQLHRRQKAIARLGQFATEFTGSNISHYVLPMIENYAFVTDESLRNVANETITTIEKLISCVSYKQFLAIFKRYMSGLKEGSETLRDSVSLVVTISKALLKNLREGGERSMEGLAREQDQLDTQIETEMIEPIAKVLNKRNDETIIHRTPLIEALACLVLCLSPDRIVITLPGILTKICQILRSRSDGLRDAVRKHLGRASKTLGAKYIRFIIKELKTALARGFQVHVLGFTVHTILSEMNFKHGELDDSASLIMNVVMENIFGSTGQEKEADGYRTTMKEVKNNKSFDIAELLSRVISISRFNDLVAPVKMLLQERITLKIQNKLDELLRRIALGIYKNDDATKTEMLVLSYELFKESERDLNSERKVRVETESEKHFLVQLNAKQQRVETENSTYIETFQKFSLELLRSTLKKNPEFVTAENLVGFLPLFEKALTSDNESVSMTMFKILGMAINVQFDVDGDIFKRASRRCLNIIKDFPSTESELVQASLKYLAIVIRHRDDLALKESSLGYLLVRIQPDLNEQNRQGLAFNFLKALVSKHVMIPEVYDTMDKIREVMVTSHSKERRDMSRSIYFQFLMEYDQGRGRLEKQFKFLVDNLGYPAETGKQSVMELLHLIIQKSGPELLSAVSSSFFVALSKVLISETSTKSREMAIALITTLFEKKGTESFEKFIRGWMNSKNSALLKCSLQLYRIKVKVSGVEGDTELDEEVLANIRDIMESSKADSEVEVKWELLYTALSCLSVVVEKRTDIVDESLKADIISSLLFPHSWIRLASSRLISAMLAAKKELFTDADLQNIGYRLFHQLNAPSVDEKLSSQAVKTLSGLLMHWEKNAVVFDESLRIGKDESDAENEEVEDVEEGTEQVRKMSDWAIARASAVVRSDRTSVASKKSGIQFLAICAQVLSEERVDELGENLVLPLFILSEIESDDDERIELQKLAVECLKLIEGKIGVSKYTSHYSKVGQFVLKRRQERRTKRARLAITAPEAAARRKIKKHVRGREKRKHEKDENGYYHTKKKKMSRR